MRGGKGGGIKGGCKIIFPGKGNAFFFKYQRGEYEFIYRKQRIRGDWYVQFVMGEGGGKGHDFFVCENKRKILHFPA